MTRAVLIAGVLLIASACHRGWVRPGATEYDFLHDYDCCCYGCDEELKSEAAGGRQQQGDTPKRLKRDYKLCLRSAGGTPCEAKVSAPSG